MCWIARRKAAWVTSAWLTAVGLAQAGDPSAPPPSATKSPMNGEAVSPALPAPAPELIPLYSRPASPYGPALPGLHPAVTATPILVGESGPVPHESAPLLPNPGVVETSPWANLPQIQPLPRLGLFLVPPTGPGYYSFVDVLYHDLRDKPPSLAFPPYALAPTSGFDADYRYLDSPDDDRTNPFDHLKRIHPTPDTMLTIGGELRARYINEIDSRLGRTDNEYMLYRNRIWADFWYTDSFRVYAEMINAFIDGNDLPPLPIDENQAAFLNLFAEVRVCDLGGAPVYVRVGRQEMLFGSQRLISTRDWTNTRISYDGVRAYRRTDELAIDAFAVHPVTVYPTKQDRADTHTLFYGIWSTYRPMAGTTFDLYYLGLNNDSLVTDRFTRAFRGEQEINTFGARWAGNQGSLLYDFEGMCQQGTNAQRDLKAYAYSAGLGWESAEHPCRPQLWVTYDYASGTSDPLSGRDHTFNQLYGFGHYYFGYLDLVGRQNIEDLSFQAVAFPDRWLTLLGQFHHFQLAEARDFLYNAAGVPTRRSALGLAGRDVGNEIDLLANIHLKPNHDILVGYSKLFAGDFIRNTGPNVSPELFYAMYNIRW
jgi:hypothetical protein